MHIKDSQYHSPLIRINNDSGFINFLASLLLGLLAAFSLTHATCSKLGKACRSVFSVDTASGHVYKMTFFFFFQLYLVYFSLN